MQQEEDTEYRIMAGIIAPNIITDDLIFYVDAANTKSYVSGSTIWNTLAQQPFSASLENGPTYSPNNSGILIFDGTNDFCATNFVGTFTSITINTWFYRNGNQPSQYSGLVASRGGSGGNTTGLLLNIAGNESLGYNWNDQANTYSWNSGLVLTDQAWNFLSLIVAPTYAIGFLNGVTATNSVTHTFATNLRNLAIGKDYATERRVRGSIGSVSIYNRALSVEEVSQIYNTTKTRYGL